MDTVENYRQIIENVLSHHEETCYANVDGNNEALFDRRHDRYCVLSIGWQGMRRVHGCLIHIDLIGDKVWIQRDDTEDGVAYELEAAGIPRQAIVLGFKPPAVRRYTAYALA
ncbi:MAG: XisI protein [Gammaproteobacteria bacterium]|nr:XisI protein [Gammaproteobacteria bacterium]